MRNTVLIIDDDPGVAEAVRRTLCTEHDVVKEHDPTVALEMLRSGAQFDLVLCDVLMPQMTGTELIRELATTHPKVADRVVFLTGSVGETDLGLPNALIAKPFRVEALRRRVRELVQKG